MIKIWILAIALFLVLIFLFWLLTRGYMKKKYGIKMLQHWPTRLAYWQAAILYSLVFTFSIIYLLKWAGVFTF